MCWLRVDLFKQPKPKTRAMTMEVASVLVEAAPPGPKRLPSVRARGSATRSRSRGPEIDRTRGTERFHIGKTDTWTEHPLAAEMVEALAAIPKEERTGRLFPWSDKSSVYYWLGPAAARGRLGQRFSCRSRPRCRRRIELRQRRFQRSK